VSRMSVSAAAEWSGERSSGLGMVVRADEVGKKWIEGSCTYILLRLFFGKERFWEWVGTALY
jgi:hypothetical protein